jgi:hypothetical protein
MTTDRNDLQSLKGSVQSMLAEMDRAGLSASELWDAVREPLARNSVWVSHKIELRHTHVRVETTFASAAHEWETMSISSDLLVEREQPVGGSILRMQLENLVHLIHRLVKTADDTPSSGGPNSTIPRSLGARLRGNTLVSGDRSTWGILSYLPPSVKETLGSLRYAAASLRSRRNAEFIHRHPEYWRAHNPCNAWPVPKSGLIFWWRVLEGAYRLTKVRLGFLPPN